MKKASFITIHVGFNFGSKLQTIATCEILKKLGYETTCVNYIPPRVTHGRYWKTAITNRTRFIKRLLFYPVYLIIEHNYNRYLRNHCNLSRAFYAKDNFINSCPKADIYISGSDQLWNYKHNEGNDKHYFFDGIEGNKIAYASSFGMTSLPEMYSLYVKEQLSQYKAISVREQSAVDLLSGLGIPAINVLDPTFMLTKDEWQLLASKRLVRSKYIFVYLPYNIKNIELIYSSVRKIAKSKNLLVVSYSDSLFRDKNADKTIYFVNPGDILSLILNAEYVVTNSFHGTAFSINLNKQFWVYMPSAFSTRISNILCLCGLDSRLLHDRITSEQVEDIIDYDTVNMILKNERNISYNFLINALR